MNDLRGYLAAEVVEDYRQGRIPRREALKRLAGLTGTALAMRMLDATGAPAQASPASSPSDATAVPNRTAPGDPSLVARPVRFAGEDAELSGYLARPSQSGRHPIVLVCHENRGLTPHIEDVARRLAKAGYAALAVDLLSREGGTGNNDRDRIPAMLGNAPGDRAVRDFQSGLAYMQAQSFADPDRSGMVGFCYGGGVTWRVAAATPELRAVVVYYGQPVPASEVPKIAAAVLAIYAGRDARINATIPAIEAAMQQHKTFRKIVYPDVDHAFNNDTGDRYDPSAAKAAWDETLRWFGRYLATKS